MKTTNENAKRTGRPIELKGVLGDLARAMGGLAAVSDAIGASPRTIRDWANGKTRPRGPALKMLDKALKEAKLPAWDRELPRK